MIKLFGRIILAVGMSTTLAAGAFGLPRGVGVYNATNAVAKVEVAFSGKTGKFSITLSPGENYIFPLPDDHVTEIDATFAEGRTISEPQTLIKEHQSGLTKPRKEVWLVDSDAVCIVAARDLKIGQSHCSHLQQGMQ